MIALDQFPFRELTTAAGIAAAAVLIRQVIEFAKGSFLPWLDAANERKGVFILAGLLYLAWLVIYGKNLETDLPAAVAAVWACGIASIGTNEAVDAAKGVAAKNMAQTVASDPVANAAATTAGIIGGGASRQARPAPRPTMRMRRAPRSRTPRSRPTAVRRSSSARTST